MIRRRRRRRRKGRIPLWVPVTICAVLATAYWTVPPIPRASRSLTQPEVSPGGEPAPVRAAAAARGNGRTAYRHSVIPGGAFSVAEVERARGDDPVVNAHYAVFDAARLRMTQAPAPRPVYVSYRIGSDVYWTRHRVVLAAGEALITDGGHMARARCGNRVADTPQQPVAAHEPPAADLDALELPVPPETDWELPSALVVDVFPPVPLSPMAQIVLAKPGSPSSSQSSSTAGVGMGLGTVAGLPAPPVSGSTVPPPVNGGINGPPGPGPFVPAPWPGPPATGWYLPLPGPIGNAPLLPSPWLPSTPAPNDSFGPTAPAGPNPNAGTWGLVPLPGTWSFTTPPIILPGPQGAGPGPPKTGGTPGVVLPPPIPSLPPSDPPVEPLPEPATAMLVAAALAVVVISEIRRRA